MAAVNPPFVIQDQTHSSDIFRRMVRALRASQGVVSSGDLAVSQNGTPNMSVNVAAGLVIVDGTQDTTHQGSYVCLNDATANLTIAAADPTNPRIDIVVAQVQDSQYSGATDAWKLAVVTGTPAPSPSAPAAPANSVILAQVAVAANASSIVNANITDYRTFPNTNLYRARAHASGLTSITSGSAVKVALGAKDYDPNGNFDAVTTFLYTCPVPGYYRVTGAVSLAAATDLLSVIAMIYKNGSLYTTGGMSQGNGTQGPHSTVGDTIKCAAGDTLGLYAQASTTTNDQALSDSVYLVIEYAGN